VPSGAAYRPASARRQLAFVGRDYVSVVIEGIQPLTFAGLASLPVVGKLVFGHNPLVYASLALFGAVQWFLYRTRAGLVLRAVGEAPHSAHAIGYHVLAIRYAAVQSEEGGRFHCFQNRYMVVELPASEAVAVPDDFVWMTLAQLHELTRFGMVNIEARNLLACLSLL